MKKNFLFGFHSLILLSICFSTFSLTAQNYTPINDRFQAPEFQDLLSQPFQWDPNEENVLQNIIYSPRYNSPELDKSFSLSNTTQLGLLKEMLDVIPSKAAIVPFVQYPSNTPMVTYKPGPDCVAVPDNVKTPFNEVHIEYNIGSVPGAQDQTVFDITRNNLCNKIISTDFIVDINGKIGFGIAVPQSKYHFAIPQFQVGDAGTLQFKIDNTTNNERMIFSKGDLELFKVNKDGKAFARAFEVTLANPFPDYVFDKDYALTPLKDVEEYINQHKHLPGIKPAEEYAQNGTVDLGELQLKILEKVEELTLHVIAQQKALEQQQSEIEAIKKRLEEGSR